MAPPGSHNGMSLHSIGYATLKYPELAPELPVPIENQIGALQYIRDAPHNHWIAQLASQYLPTLLEHQANTIPQTYDRTSPQYYLSATLALLNILTTNPDVSHRIVQHPTIVRDTIEKLLDPDVENGMKTADRSNLPGGDQFARSSWEDDFGTMLQFVSTMLLYVDEPESLHPRIKELVPILKGWAKKYKNSRCKTISNASDRLPMQIQGMEPSLRSSMRAMQATSVICGVVGCPQRDSLTACGACKIQRYCSKEHQKQDWKYHKHICNKGLVE